jgi:hypothetical protein
MSTNTVLVFSTCVTGTTVLYKYWSSTVTYAYFYWRSTSMPVPWLQWHPPTADSKIVSSSRKSLFMHESHSILTYLLQMTRIPKDFFQNLSSTTVRSTSTLQCYNTDSAVLRVHWYQVQLLCKYQVRVLSKCTAHSRARSSEQCMTSAGRSPAVAVRPISASPAMI